jgi:hypothetical protein
MEPSALFGGDEDKLLKVVNSQVKLVEFTDRKNFKTFEELARKLNDVLDGGSTPGTSAANMAEDENYTPPVRTPAPAAKPVSVAKVSAGDDEDVMSYFQKIADEA